MSANDSSLRGEIWKAIPGFEGLYQVSNKGRIKSVGRWKFARPNESCRQWVRERILKLGTHKAGYKIASPCKNGTAKPIGVHCLVLLAFVGPKPNPRYEACHKNGKPADNRLENLRWGTPKDNAQDRTRHGRSGRWHPHGSKSSLAVLTEEAVLKIRRLHQNGKKREELATLFKVHKVTIQDIVNRRTWRHI